MDLVHQWFLSNLDVVFLVYATAILVMGITLLAQPHSTSDLAIARVLWLFIAYALLHAPADFLDMLAVRRPEPPWLEAAGEVLTFAAYLFLFEFGRRLMGLAHRVVPWWILPLAAAGVVFGSAVSSRPWVTANILMGYLVRFPGGVLAGLGLALYYQSHKHDLPVLRLKKHFVCASAAMLAWAIVCGVVRKEGSFFPATWVNIHSFQAATGFPVYLFRAVCAVVLTWSLFGIVRIFEWESGRRLQEELGRRAQAEAALRAARDELDVRVQQRTAELTKANEALWAEVERRTQTEVHMRQARDAAHAASRAKGDFIAKVSHDLRTPLGIIIGMSDIVIETDLTAEQRQCVESIRRAGGFQLALIDDLLELARIEAHKLELSPVDFRLRPVLDDLVRLFEPHARGKGLRFTVTVNPGVPDRLNGDAKRIQQIIVNLVGNAIKFTDRGEVTVRAAVAEPAPPVSGADVVLRFRVTDTGIGIPTEELPVIFDAFRQVHQSPTDGHGGTGLGLTISKELAVLLGGDLGVESQPGKGSAFTLTVPLRQPATATPSTAV